MGSGISLIQEYRAGGERSTMLSRVADSLYWMSRYLERAENTVRQLDVTMSLMLDTGGANVETRWQRMVAALGKPAGMDWNGIASRRWRTSSSSISSSRLCHLLPQRRRAKMPARCAKKSPPSCGSASIASFIRFTRPMRRRSSVQHQRHARLRHGWHLPLQRHHRHHHDSRPGMAVHPPRPLP